MGNWFVSIINASLGYFNWLIIPLKLILCIAVSLITRLIEPYKSIKVKTNSNDTDHILNYSIKLFENVLWDEFKYKDFIRCTRKTTPSGVGIRCADIFFLTFNLNYIIFIITK